MVLLRIAMWVCEGVEPSKWPYLHTLYTFLLSVPKHEGCVCLAESTLLYHSSGHLSSSFTCKCADYVKLRYKVIVLSEALDYGLLIVDDEGAESPLER